MEQDKKPRVINITDKPGSSSVGRIFERIVESDRLMTQNPDEITVENSKEVESAPDVDSTDYIENTAEPKDN